MPCLVAHLQVTESWFSLPLPDATTSEQQDALRVSNLGALLRQLLPALVSDGLAAPVFPGRRCSSGPRSFAPNAAAAEHCPPASALASACHRSCSSYLSKGLEWHLLWQLLATLMWRTIPR